MTSKLWLPFHCYFGLALFKIELFESEKVKFANKIALDPNSERTKKAKKG